MSRHRRHRHAGRGGPARQRGIALLVAILLVAIGTIIAAAMAYENAMTARRGASTYAFDQTILVAQAGEALAAWGLRAVAQTYKSQINLTQGWDKPQGPFEIVPGVTVTLQLEDVAGRFNLNSLVNTNGTPNQVAVAAFQQLLTNLSLEPKWANLMVDWIDQDIIPQNPDGAEDSVYMEQQPPYRTPNMYITSTTEILALPGFGHDRYKALAPYIVALPIDAKVNICTAPGMVLDAFTPGRQEFGTDPDGLYKNRTGASGSTTTGGLGSSSASGSSGCFPSLSEYQQSFPSPQSYTQASSMFATTSSYFRLHTFVTIDTAEFNLYSLLLMDSTGNVRPLLRTFTPD